MLRAAHKDDVSLLLTLLDRNVAWLAAQGLEKQWGPKPFSLRPSMVTRVEQWVASGATTVAERDGVVIGMLVLADAPPAYAAAAWAERGGDALYIDAIATDPIVRGQAVGQLLLRHSIAEAKRRGLPHLRLDCWGDNPTLLRLYRHAGFTRCGSFLLGDWRGALFEQVVG